MSSITLDMPLRELMLLDPSIIEVLQHYHLGCASCLGAQFETLKDACVAHGLQSEEVLMRLNEALAASDTRKDQLHG